MGFVNAQQLMNIIFSLVFFFFFFFESQLITFYFHGFYMNGNGQTKCVVFPLTLHI